MYALGALSPEERLEVEAMAAGHQEIRDELSAIENSLEAYAEENAVEPSENLRQRVMNSLVTNLGDDRTFVATAAPKRGADSEARVVSMTTQRKTTFYKYAFAASLLLLCLSVAALATVYQSLQRANGQLLSLQLQNEHYSKTVQFKNEELDVYRGDAYKRITLKGLPKSPSSSMMLAWNPAKKKVMLSPQHMDLPKNDAQHQYQLWALVKGKPVDLGVFDANEVDSADQDMLVMKSIGEADAFAVTLEPRGGSVNPTLTEMMVMGKL